jgi:hypothetical protein
VRSATLIIITLTVNGALLWAFHDRYWYAPDEGNYAHIAERVLDGQVLHRDIQDLHPGYINWLNAAAMRVFGRDLLSLRYPLIGASFATACLTLVLVGRRNLWLGSSASVGTIALGVIQFPNPTAHWYSLFLTLALTAWLTWLPLRSAWRLFGTGFLLGLLILFRHLTGVWVAMAVLIVVLTERSSDAAGYRAAFGRSLIAAALMILLTYVLLNRETEPGGLLFMALWPAAILVVTLSSVRVDNREACRALGLLGAGAVVAALPLLAYHGWHGSGRNWVNDVIFSSYGLTRLDFFGRGWYGVLPLAGFHQALTSGDLRQSANGLYWVALPLLSAASGLMLLRRLRSGYRAHDLIVPIMAAFYALVSLHFEGPTYLYYSAGFSLAGLLSLQSDAQRWQWGASVAFAISISIVAVHFHAAQPHVRTPVQILKGERFSADVSATPLKLTRAHLRVYRPDGENHERLVALIRSVTKPQDAIFAMPSDAQLYFLADRPNPFRFYNTALGIRTDEDLASVLQQLELTPPRLVTFRPEDKYNTEASLQIAGRVRSTYQLLDTIGGVQVYVAPERHHD